MVCKNVQSVTRVGQEDGSARHSDSEGWVRGPRYIWCSRRQSPSAFIVNDHSRKERHE